MDQKPGTTHDWTVHVLNIHGAIFERRVAHLVRQNSLWRVHATHYPVEVPGVTGLERGKESALDLWAQSASPINSEWLLSLFIECKKNDPGFVDWVFIEADSGTKWARDFAIHSLHAASDEKGRRKRLRVLAPRDDIAVCDDARETRGRYDGADPKDKRESTKTSTKAIGEAAYQVAMATRAIGAQQYEMLDLPGPRPWERHAFLPTIVTTANLLVAKFDPAKVDASDGTIAYPDVNLKPVDEILYLYPLPRHLQQSISTRQLTRAHELHLFTKLPILVVNSKTFPAYLEYVHSFVYLALEKKELVF